MVEAYTERIEQLQDIQEQKQLRSEQKASRQTAIQFKMNNPSLIVSWNNKLLKEGIEGEGLQEKAKGHPYV